MKRLRLENSKHKSHIPQNLKVKVMNGAVRLCEKILEFLFDEK